jgi:hypothetical protein
MRFLLPLLVAAALAAQTTEPPPSGSLSGTVTDSSTGTPIAGAVVAAGKASAKTDAQGRYTVTGLAPGPIQLMSGHPGYSVALKSATVIAGLTVSVNLALPPHARITGKVIDENGDPVANIVVQGLSRIYAAGELVYRIDSGTATTNAAGEYQIARIFPGLPIVLLAADARTLKPQAVPAVSGASENAEKRERVTVPTFYPDAVLPERGELLELRPGEERHLGDIRLRRLPSYCVSGVVAGASGPGPLAFSVGSKTAAALGRIGAIAGTAQADGRFRVCGLAPGEYRISATETASTAAIPSAFGFTAVTVNDRDVEDLKVSASPWITVPGEVAIEGTAPETPVEGTLALSFTRAEQPRAESDALRRQVAIPGGFSVPLLFAADYGVGVRGIPKGWYLKDVTYAGVGIANRRLHPSAIQGAAALRIVLANDGGYIGVRVTSDDNRPIAGANIAILPDLSVPDAEFAGRILTARSDQFGAYTSAMLEPGKYYVLATEAENDPSPESVTRLLRARPKAKEVVVSAGGTAHVEIESSPISR